MNAASKYQSAMQAAHDRFDAAIESAEIADYAAIDVAIAKFNQERAEANQAFSASTQGISLDEMLRRLRKIETSANA